VLNIQDKIRAMNKADKNLIEYDDSLYQNIPAIEEE